MTDDRMTGRVIETDHVLDIKPSGGNSWIAVDGSLDAFNDSGLKVARFTAEKHGDGSLFIKILLKP